MKLAEVDIRTQEFGKPLKDMRRWLDAMRFSPSTFTYFFLVPGIRLRIAFDLDDEAAAFATRFGGILVDTAGGKAPPSRRPPNGEPSKAGARTGIP
jgi:hypothetical protein